MNDSSENQEVEDNQLEPQEAGVETVGDDELAEVVESDEKKTNPLFSDEAEDDDYDYEDLDDEESRVVWYFAAFLRSQLKLSVDPKLSSKSVLGLLFSPISIANPVECSEYPGGAETLALSIAI